MNLYSIITRFFIEGLKDPLHRSHLLFDLVVLAAWWLVRLLILVVRLLLLLTVADKYDARFSASVICVSSGNSERCISICLTTIVASSAAADYAADAEAAKQNDRADDYANECTVADSSTHR